jgi:hypothetical protein
MKHKLTQKEWNDKRDAFLCAIIQGAIVKAGNYVNEEVIDSANILTFQLYEVVDHNVDTTEKVEETMLVPFFSKVEDTRPFNPKVVEIFEKYLPKEIAPLAIEAHKRSCENSDGEYLRTQSEPVYLEDCLLYNLNWFSIQGCDFNILHSHIEENTITATPEQLREWFPLAYQNEGGENEL